MNEEIKTRVIRDRNGKIIGSFVGRKDDMEKFTNRDVNEILNDQLRREKDQQDRR